MTWICHGASTKRELAAKLKDPLRIHDVSFEDPSFFKPQYIEAADAPFGFHCVCTNHPRRSWFAQVTRTDSGYKVK